jgi:hypothetical protein
MTLNELLNQVQFDDVRNEIIKYDPEMQNNLMGVKIAFDCLRLMTPGESDGDDIVIDYYKESKKFTASFCDDNHWNIVIARNIRVSKRVHGISKEMIAALCGWEASFYGFSEATISDQFHEMCSYVTPGNHYEAELKEKDIRWTEQDCRTLRSMRQEIKRNGPKQKRYRRQMERLTLLRRKAKIWHFCQYREKHRIANISEEDLWQLLHTHAFCYERVDSHSDTPEQAATYLCELFTKYFPYSPEEAEREWYIFMIYGGKSCRQEMPQLTQLLKEKFPKSLIGIGDAEEEPIHLMMIQSIEIPL